MSLPWLKGAISGPIRVYRLTVTAAHFSANRVVWRRGKRGVRERKRRAGQVGLFVSECVRLATVDSKAGD